MSAVDVLYTCTECKREFAPKISDRFCPQCRDAWNTVQMARTECPRCRKPWAPTSPNAWACDDCEQTRFLEDIARYGSN